MKSRRDNVVHVDFGARRPADAHEMAARLFDEADALDEDPATLAKAEALYRRVVFLCPSHAKAHTNLGNVLYLRGREAEAVRCYRRAIELDPSQPEAHHNMGIVLFEREMRSTAFSAAHFRRAVRADPSFAPAHFYLGLHHEEMGEPEEARPHWEKYVELEPEGALADVARSYLS